MKDTLLDANFPRTSDLRVYHLGVRPGEVANRIITVGSSLRAHRIAAHLDVEPKPFQLLSERGFLTITGRFKGVPITILSIGMGSANMDFFVREVRECIIGDLVIIRLGSCGALVEAPVGSVIAPRACVAVTRNLDFDFTSPVEDSSNPPYKISKLVNGDPDLHATVLSAVNSLPPFDDSINILEGVNASADSFYSSQGRKTSFPDHNEEILPQLLDSALGVQTLEMETHHLYYLANVWNSRTALKSNQPRSPESQQMRLADPSTWIRASAVQIIFASRTSQAFISPETVARAEEWSGTIVLEALANFQIDNTHLHPEEGSVWFIAKH